MASRNISARRAGQAGIDGTGHRLKRNSLLSVASRVRPTCVDPSRMRYFWREGGKDRENSAEVVAKFLR